MAPLCKSQTKKGQQALNADHIFESPYSSPCFFFLTSPPPSLSSLVLGNIKQNSFLHTHAPSSQIASKEQEIEREKIVKEEEELEKEEEEEEEERKNAPKHPAFLAWVL